MAYVTSDDDLRRKLQQCGVEVGPITASTRRLYLKQWKSLMNNPGSLSAFSSDDSEIEQFDGSASKNLRKKRHNHRTSTSSRVLLAKESKSQDVFKKPLPTPPRFSPRLNAVENSSTTSRGSLTRRSRGLTDRDERASFDIETSDSDFDSDPLTSSTRTLRTPGGKSPTHNHYVGDPASEGGGSGIFRKSSKSFLASTPNGDDYNRSQQQSDWAKKFSKRSSTSLYNNIKSSKEYNANGYVSDILNGEFQSSKGAGKTTNYSHCVSWMLVLGTAAFFVVIGLFYMSGVQKTQTAANRKQVEMHICAEGKKGDNCIPRNYFSAVLEASHELYDVLSVAAGEYECQFGRESRSVAVYEAKNSLREVLETGGDDDDVEEPLKFDEVFSYTILLAQKIPAWGISILTDEEKVAGSTQPVELSHISALESKHASKTFWCRLKISLQWVVARIVLLLSSLAVLAISIGVLKLLKRRKELEEKEFYDLVERIIEALQEQSADDSSSSQSGVMPSRAVVHLRDSLIPPKDRRAKQELWDRVVSFIEENESRVQVDYERIGGEEFKVWRWMPSPAAEAESGKHGKVWQGQAFGSLSKGKNHVQYSPTPCLKIRNMFDPEMEYGDDWQVSVQDAILEKCEGNDGIVHIAVDTSSSEGCIYMLCNSCEAAGKAYSALHGWWFDGKLVTVKFLRLERYLERYPSAEHCVKPLKPSNNKRLSLSTPFFSSALERS